MLSLSDITVQMGTSTLIHQVDLTVQPGTLTAVVGPNGAGKTTALRVASGELTPQSGIVSMDGELLVECSNRDTARRRAVLAQQSHLRFAFPVLQVVLMGRTPHLNGAETARDWQIAESALAAVGLVDFAERSFPTLSAPRAHYCGAARARRRGRAGHLARPESGCAVRRSGRDAARRAGVSERRACRGAHAARRAVRIWLCRVRDRPSYAGLSAHRSRA